MMSLLLFISLFHFIKDKKNAELKKMDKNFLIFRSFLPFIRLSLRPFRKHFI